VVGSSNANGDAGAGFRGSAGRSGHTFKQIAINGRIDLLDTRRDATISRIP
jgi:hypothetical protein